MEPVRFANMIEVFDLSRVTPEDTTGAQAAVRSSRIQFFFVNIDLIHFVYTRHHRALMILFQTQRSTDKPSEAMYCMYIHIYSTGLGKP